MLDRLPPEVALGVLGRLSHDDCVSALRAFPELIDERVCRAQCQHRWGDKTRVRRWIVARDDRRAVGPRSVQPKNYWQLLRYLSFVSQAEGVWYRFESPLHDLPRTTIFRSRWRSDGLVLDGAGVDALGEDLMFSEEVVSFCPRQGRGAGLVASAVGTPRETLAIGTPAGDEGDGDDEEALWREELWERGARRSPAGQGVGGSQRSPGLGRSRVSGSDACRPRARRTSSCVLMCPWTSSSDEDRGAESSGASPFRSSLLGTPSSSGGFSPPPPPDPHGSFEAEFGAFLSRTRAAGARRRRRTPRAAQPDWTVLQRLPKVVTGRGLAGSPYGSDSDRAEVQEGQQWEEGMEGSLEDAVGLEEEDHEEGGEGTVGDGLAGARLDLRATGRREALDLTELVRATEALFTPPPRRFPVPAGEVAARLASSRAAARLPSPLTPPQAAARLPSPLASPRAAARLPSPLTVAESPFSSAPPSPRALSVSSSAPPTPVGRGRGGAETETLPSIQGRAEPGDEAGEEAGMELEPEPVPEPEQRESSPGDWQGGDAGREGGNTTVGMRAGEDPTPSRDLPISARRDLGNDPTGRAAAPRPHPPPPTVSPWVPLGLTGPELPLPGAAPGTPGLPLGLWVGVSDSAGGPAEIFCLRRQSRHGRPVLQLDIVRPRAVDPYRRPHAQPVPALVPLAALEWNGTQRGLQTQSQAGTSDLATPDGGFATPFTREGPVPEAPLSPRNGPAPQALPASPPGRPALPSSPATWSTRLFVFRSAEMWAVAAHKRRWVPSRLVWSATQRLSPNRLEIWWQPQQGEDEDCLLALVPMWTANEMPETELDVSHA